MQSISSFLNLSCSQHDFSALNNNFGQHHNNFSDYSEFSSNFTTAISCQQSLQTTISLHSNTTLSDNSGFSSNCTTSLPYQQFLQIMSKIPLRPSALYRQQKKIDQLEELCIALAKRMSNMQSQDAGDMPANERPPHY